MFICLMIIAKQMYVIIVILQAAKEFESELSKEPDSLSDSPGEKPTAVSEEKKQDVEISSSKESA